MDVRRRVPVSRQRVADGRDFGVPATAKQGFSGQLCGRRARWHDAPAGIVDRPRRSRELHALPGTAWHPSAVGGGHTPRACVGSGACRPTPGTLPQALRAGGTPTRRTGRKPRYIQYEGFRPAHREHAPDAARPALRANDATSDTPPSAPDGQRHATAAPSRGPCPHPRRATALRLPDHRRRPPPSPFGSHDRPTQPQIQPDPVATPAPHLHHVNLLRGRDRIRRPRARPCRGPVPTG